MRRLGLSLVLLSAAALLPTGAQAQVVVDPDSPAGKEYAIPLDTARETGRSKKGRRTANPGGGRFGEGISKSGNDRDGSASTKDGGTGTDDGSKGKSRKSRKDSDGDEALGGGSGGGGSGGGGSGDGGSSAGLLTGGIALAVLLIGGAVALMTRRAATE